MRHIIILITLFLSSCELMPRNTLEDCRSQCPGAEKTAACYEFCNCIHTQGRPLDSCLDEYERAAADSLHK